MRKNLPVTRRAVPLDADETGVLECSIEQAGSNPASLVGGIRAEAGGVRAAAADLGTGTAAATDQPAAMVRSHDSGQPAPALARTTIAAVERGAAAAFGLRAAALEERAARAESAIDPAATGPVTV